MVCSFFSQLVRKTPVLTFFPIRLILRRLDDISKVFHGFFAARHSNFQCKPIAGHKMHSTSHEITEVLLQIEMVLHSHNMNIKCQCRKRFVLR